MLDFPVFDKEIIGGKTSKKLIAVSMAIFFLKGEKS
jgi:hypothetical protein